MPPINVHMKLRSGIRQLLTAVIKGVTTASNLAFAATSTTEATITRLSGSFLDDGFAAGDEIQMSGWQLATGGNGRWLATQLDDTHLYVHLPEGAARTLANESAGGLIALTAGCPVGQSDEGIVFSPKTGEPWFRESYKAGPERRRSIGPQARVRLDWLYILTVFYPSGVGAAGLEGMADAVRELLYPGRLISYNSQTFTILASSRQGFVIESDWMSVPISVRGFAHTLTP